MADSTVNPSNVATPEDIDDMHRRFLRYQQDQNRNRAILLAVPVGTSSTPIAHGQPGRIPRLFTATPDANATVWRAAAPDANLIYVIASVACNADIVVEY